MLRDDGMLQWEYCEPLELSSAGTPAPRSVTSGDKHAAFDAGPIQIPILRPRSPLEGPPPSEPTPPPDETGSADD